MKSWGCVYSRKSTKRLLRLKFLNQTNYKSEMVSWRTNKDKTQSLGLGCSQVFVLFKTPPMAKKRERETKKQTNRKMNRKNRHVKKQKNKKGREGKGREGKGREGKGREGKGRNIQKSKETKGKQRQTCIYISNLNSILPCLRNFVNICYCPKKSYQLSWTHALEGPKPFLHRRVGR